VALLLLIASSASAFAVEQAPLVLVQPFSASAHAPRDWGPDVEARFSAKFDVVARGKARALYDVTALAAESLEADEIRRYADAREAQWVMVGAWQALGAGDTGRVAEVELSSGHSGAVAHRYRFRWDAAQPSPADIEAEIERVAVAVVDDLGVTVGAASGTTEDLAVAAPMMSAVTNDGRGKRSDFLSVERDEPIEINAEDLELHAMGDTKHLIFRRDVSVVQGEMRLYAGHLEAFYPRGASQPDRLDARDSVRVVEGDMEVRCREASYLRNDELVICRGDALLLQGCDEVRGSEMEFHIAEERVEVKGAASVVLWLDAEEGQTCESGSAG